VKRVIIVDDDELVRTSAGLYFEDDGWAVSLASNAAQALELAKAPFDAMICDLHLTARRGAEGLAVLTSARALAPGAALVLLSGEGASDAGAADAVFQKPIRLPVLVERLSALIASR
jgi:DNA-binding response OmpR family regulator